MQPGIAFFYTQMRRIWFLTNAKTFINYFVCQIADLNFTGHDSITPTGFLFIKGINMAVIEATFLGTISNVPTKERAHSTVHLKYLNHNYLFDCGEGAQRQMILAGVSPYKIEAVFITHLHADHLMGLWGLAQTLNFWERESELPVYGPRGIEEYARFFSVGKFRVRGIEIKPGLIYKTTDCKITAFPVEHSCECYGFVFEEVLEPNLDKAKLKKIGLLNSPLCRKLKSEGEIKWHGKTVCLDDVIKCNRRPIKIAYVMDTKPTDSIVENAAGADLFICESTYAEEMRDQAHEYGHMTAKDAARLAKKARVKQLVLTHFSPRYEDVAPLKREARTIFKDTETANDLMKIEI